MDVLCYNLLILEVTMCIRKQLWQYQKYCPYYQTSTYVLTTFKGTRPVIKELLSTNLMNKKAKAHEILCLFWNHHLRNSDFLLVISKLLYKKTQKRGVENWELCMIWWWWGIMMTSDEFGSTKIFVSGTYPKPLRKMDWKIFFIFQPNFC